MISSQWIPEFVLASKIGRAKFRRARITVLGSLIAIALLGGSGCTQDMKNQPKQRTLSQSEFYANGSSSRLLPEGTVARGHLREDDLYYRGFAPDGSFTRSIPVTVDAQLLTRGKERYEIFCSPCHGSQGDGLGMIVRRGFQQPESYHQARLRGMPEGYFFDVITNGFGQMSGYASQVPVDDRWAIVSYIRALQLSRQVESGELDAQELRRIDEPAPVGDSHSAGESTGHDGGH